MPSLHAEAADPAVPQPPAAAAPLRPAPGPREIVLIAGFSFLLYLVLGVGVALFVPGLRAGLVICETLSFVLPPLVAVRLFYLDGRAVLPFRRPLPRHLVAALFGTVGLNHLLTMYAVWQERLWPSPESLRALDGAYLSFQGPLEFVWLLAAVAIVPAVCEEILFRGFVQSGLVRLREQAWLGVAGTAVLFGVFHLHPWRFPMVVVLGLFLGWLRQTSGSLWPAILAHGLNNALTISLLAMGAVGDERAAGNVLTVALAAGLVLLALACGHARPGEGANRML